MLYAYRGTIYWGIGLVEDDEFRLWSEAHRNMNATTNECGTTISLIYQEFGLWVRPTGVRSSKDGCGNTNMAGTEIGCICAYYDIVVKQHYIPVTQSESISSP